MAENSFTEFYLDEDLIFLYPSQHLSNKSFVYEKNIFQTKRILKYLIIFFTILIGLLFLVKYSDVKYSQIDDTKILDFYTVNNNTRYGLGISTQDDQCSLVIPQARIDCNPDPPISQDVCLARGCCWMPSEGSNFTKESNKLLPPVNVPYCYFGAGYVGYNITRIEENHENPSKIIELKRVRSSGFENDIELVQLQVDELSESTLRIQLTDLKTSRYRVPFPVLKIPQKSSKPKLYTVHVYGNNRTLVVYRTKTMVPVFEVNLALIIYSDQFIQITSDLPSKFFYGLGELREPFRKSTNWKRYTLFNRDQYPVPDLPLYGSHPFYMTTDSPDGSNRLASGVFLFNSNSMDVITQPSPAITFRTIGGILDFFLFLGPTPEDVVSQYHQLIGLPNLPPYWSLGFHLSRYGYRNMSNLEAVFKRTKEANIPYDVQWTDIDIMESNNDFTYDKQRFKELPEFIENKLHANGMRFIPMFDCGISAGENPPSSYGPYNDGILMNVFVKNHTGDVFIGKVWNRKSTVWPDFTHPNASDYWTKQFARYHQLIPFDGAWIDMNEPSNFLDGQQNGCPKNNALEKPRYTPGMVDSKLTLSHKTLCMTAQHHLGVHYNLHNLYGLTEAIVTNRALRNVLNRRPFIISRSTAPGHGHYAFHWDGDIVSDWNSMKWSIASILNFNLFGIPMVGADICGFNGNTTEELCARWHQLGAFYTFARNHNTDDAIDQDPVALGLEVESAARNALLIRYANLPYLYTLFYRVHIHGGTVLRPLFFEFPDDQIVSTIDTQFMWGGAMMIAAVVQPNINQIVVYFPKGTWYCAISEHLVISTGEFHKMPATYKFPNVYYRAGYIVPVQSAETTTEQSRKNDFNLFVFLRNETDMASGELYWDSGDGIDTVKLGQFNHYTFEIRNKKLLIKSDHLGLPMNQTINEIHIYGVWNKPSVVVVNGSTVNTTMYQNKTGVLILFDLQLSMYNDNQNEIIHTITFEY